ncbi:MULTISPECIES: hypothetical protein [Acidobacteriaceae]|uniref:hypothetical protein n=1 Tax=Acidobacteriaceae TaxID=204434 RepID=UPI00131B9164|nr:MULTISPECIES: hypothetical protein [Acidobacteriaceae]MDW5265242.1 hypothetical protein [Edaphobacter sp.]
MLFSVHVLLFAVYPVKAASTQPGPKADDPQSQAVEWTSGGVQHIYGFPDAKPKDKGSLTLSAAGLSFTGKASRAMIPRNSVVSVSAGDERVELWGKKGQILRAVIPDGGGVAAAMVMHHRVDLLTVEFTDDRGGHHGAVFFLPANEAARALESFAKTPIVAQEPQNNLCQGSSVRPHSVLLLTPIWNQVEVPAAYRTLVYERLLHQLQQVKEINHVFRDGENNAQLGCPQETMQLSISGFQRGSEVKRAILGPVGFFVSTTQMKFEVTVTDPLGRVKMQEQIKATVRGETESTNVATTVAKKLAKKYSKALNNSADSTLLKSATSNACCGGILESAS